MKYICPDIYCDDHGSPDCPHGVPHDQLPECFQYENICPNCITIEQFNKISRGINEKIQI